MRKNLVRYNLALVIALLALLVAPAVVGAFSIQDANVFRGYLYEDDWLVVIHYNNSLEPDYSNITAREAFWLQFLKTDNTVIAQVPMPAWGYAPGSIYLSNTTVSSLEWGANYTVRMWRQSAPYNNTTHIMETTEWKGADLNLLDDWCLMTASEMESYYTDEYLVDTAEKGTVLNEVGGAIFQRGIPYLSNIRPGIFMVVIGEIPYEYGVASNAYWDTLPEWNEAVGTDLSAVLTDAGLIMNLDGQQVGLAFFVLLYVAVATSVFVMGHGTAGMALALPILGLGTYFKFIPFPAMAVIVVIALVMGIRQIWWSTT